MAERFDAIVVGSGPNGLSAAITIARAGRRVLVLEAQPTIGGGVRSAELTRPGFVHDICSAIHPFGVVSPAFRDMPLEAFGLRWITPPVMLAHPLDDGTAAAMVASVDETARGFGPDADAYRHLMQPIVDDWPRLERSLLGPALTIPHHPFKLARFGMHALRSAEGLAQSVFATAAARATFSGIAAHGMLPLDHPLTAGFGLVLGALTHVAGWVMPERGSQSLSNALADYLRSLGGEIAAGAPVKSIDDLPPARAVLCDLSPKPFLSIAGHRLPLAYRRRLERYRYGMGVFKVDWALDAPIPWRAEACRRAGPYIWAARSRKLPHPSAMHGRAGLPNGRSCWSLSLRSSTRPARPRASTPYGRIATCRMRRKRTCCRGSNGRSSGSRRAFVSGSSRPR